ncbi:ribonuclease 3 [Clostridium sp. CAG:1000]|jgi:ribonuclease-3|nr:ribonuclease III [Clostridium sp.]CCX36116.1 ribonuclease 3 [Clostridium sp. CAG:1000]
MKNIFSKYGITIKNEKLLKEALTHSSYSNEHGGTCYERLEYLGDAVLEIVCSEYLYKNTNNPEGEMSRLRSLYVCENALYEYSKSINLKDYILLGNGIDEANKTIIADVFEAVMAVIYLESGLSTVKKLFNSLIVPHIESHDDFLMDYKSLLQESVQTVKKSVTYRLVEESGPAHLKKFKVEVIIDGLVFGVGEGSTKKSAEQQAAKDAYMKRAK